MGKRLKAHDAQDLEETNMGLSNCPAGVLMSFFKDPPIRSKAYLKWVKEQPCILCQAPADDPHHIIATGDGGMGTKACDLLTMPVCRPCHNKIHDTPEYWELQWKYVTLTLQKAIKNKIIKELDL